MFTAQVLRNNIVRRNFSLFNRVPYARIVQSAARHGHETVTIQRVRIRTPFFSRSRLVGAIAIGAATYTLGRYIGIKVQVGEAEDQQSTSKHPHATKDKDGWQLAGQEQDAKDDDEDYHDALLFFPTGFSRPKPKTFYKGSDPEWQEFIKLAKDRPRCEKIREELVDLVKNIVKTHPLLAGHLGTIDTNKGKTWVEIKFPDGPPVEYERPGVELTDELVWRKATRLVEDEHHKRLNKILVPTEVSKALYRDTKRKVESTWKNLRAYMGWEEKAQPDTVERVFQQVLANPPSPPGADVSPTSTTTSSAAPSAPASTPSQATASQLSGAAKELGFVLPNPKELTLDLSQFRQDVKKTYKPKSLQPPRGTFLLLSLVEVYGDRARLTVNVTAAYDPKQARFVKLDIKLFNFSLLRQRPRGGD